ncbi:anti-sigma factor family protein [Neorhodopirellula pilleata]|uniref:Uncharacterized protein n=1 Tax=Neorhodopirellula pilleata TaxID=2714738 RepID=A0A5C6AXB6_9BACT|nr:hypothetical protein [Neorhodopirellula pilleata]TWU03682.1 hypothetical protein Pla100_06120 [Neorhodopirellula pilleata]
MQEDLIGYLLGALEPDEMRRVEAWLRDSEEARRQLAKLEAALNGLDAADQNAEIEPPPVDLVARTLASLPPMLPQDNDHEQLGDFDDGAMEDAVTIRSSSQLSPVAELGGGHGWNWRDWLASVTAACVVIAIALPSMIEGRFVARKQACQDNLRELGVAMTQFVNRNAEQRLPSIAPEGYQAFAGMYGPRLREAGLLHGIERTLCPSLKRDHFWPTRWNTDAGPSMLADANAMSADANGSPDLVTLSLLDEVGRELMAINRHGPADAEMNERLLVAIEKLRWMQTTAGGHYAYNLGVRDGDYFASPRFQGRSSFAVMSDAAIVRNGPGQSDQSTTAPTLISHGGRGINVLYEDGRVGFLPAEALGQTPDHPLVNHAGQIEAGMTIDDASLAPSWQPPFIQAVQR